MTRLVHARPYRVARVAWAVVQSLPPYLWLLLRDAVGRGGNDAAWDRAHERTARRVDALASHLGGLFVKFAQIVGARGDLFPEPFVRRLRRFHDALPPRPLAALRAQLEADLGGPLASVFAEVEEPALAAASIAQVHRARLCDGTTVALKIQYPEIARITPVDLATARRVARLVSLLSGSDLASVAHEVTRFVALELDFEREARSTERVRIELHDVAGVRVPALRAPLCGPRHLVMEFLSGIPITDVDRLRAAGHDPARIARSVARLYATMIFERGFFHADPHPGNLLVLSDGGIGLLDFGLCKELPRDFAADAAAMILRGASGDGEGALEAARRLGFDVEGVDPRAGAAFMGLLMGQPVPDGAPLLGLLRANRVARIPEDFGLVVRTLVLLNGLSHALAPGERLIQAELARVLLPLAARAPATGAGAASPPVDPSGTARTRPDPERRSPRRIRTSPRPS